jgi:hypothetical protein
LQPATRQPTETKAESDPARALWERCGSIVKAVVGARRLTGPCLVLPVVLVTEPSDSTGRLDLTTRPRDSGPSRGFPSALVRCP